VVCNSAEDPARERRYLELLEEQRVQGVLITPVDPQNHLIDELPSRGTPVVLLDRTRAGNTHCSVAVDDRLGGRLALDHLIELGHRRIAFIGGPERIGQVHDRHEGALASIADAGLPADTLVDMWTDALTVDEGRTAGARIAGLPAAGRPTAAFCANDLVALGLLQGCVALGLRVPDDLAVVGYDDIEFASAATVPLTSVRQPRRELGRAAARLLLDESGNPDHVHQQLEFVPELVARGSTRQR
jgi:LacI family transcriptional regulator